MFLLIQTIDFGMILLFILVTRSFELPFLLSDERDFFWVFITKFYLLFSGFLLKEENKIEKIIIKRLILITLSCLIYILLMLFLDGKIYTVFFIAPFIINISYLLIYRKKIDLKNVVINIGCIIMYAILTLILALSLGK